MRMGRGAALGAASALVLLTITSSLVGVASCARFGAEDEPPAEGGSDATVAAPIDGATAIDGGSGARCDPRAPFEEPRPLVELNTDGDETSVRLSLDERRIYVARRSGAKNMPDELKAVYEYRRNGDRLEPPVRRFVAFGHLHEPTFSDDELTAYASTWKVDSWTLSITRRTSIDVDFGNPQDVPAGHVGGQNDREAYLVDSQLYFASGRSADGEALWTAATNTAAGALQPIKVKGTLLDSPPPAVDVAPVVSRDGQVLYFASNRESAAYRVFVAFAEGGSFGEPFRVTELSPDVTTRPTWLSPDLCRLYLSRLEDGKGGQNWNLWVAERKPR